MKTNQVIRIIIPVVLLLGAATAFIVAVLGSQQANTAVDETQESNQVVTALNAYLKIEGIDGEATEANHDKWIDVLAFSHNVMIPYSASLGRTTGTQEHYPLRVTKMIDKATPKLYEACVQDQSIASVQLDCCTAFGEELKVFYKIELQNAKIISVQDYGVASGDIPTETISLNYEAIRWTYTEYDAAGQAKGNVQSPWISAVETPT